MANEYLRQRLAPAITRRNTKKEARNLAELLADHIGVLSSSEHVPGGAQISEDTGKRFTEIVVAKHKRQRS